MHAGVRYGERLGGWEARREGTEREGGREVETGRERGEGGEG